ncbi:MAG: response regulator transcription factor [Anaerolineae bacterium]|nr:response regulator transcription factor [Anaerolineae bacterium]
MDKKVLLVGSDLTLIKRLEELLQERGYRVGKAYSLDQALWQLFHYSPQLVIIQGDTTPFSLDGPEACRRVREVSRVPIITLSSNQGERLRSLELGADDSLLRPLDMEELLARVVALMRRTDRKTVEPRLSIYSAFGIWVNFDTHEVSIGDKVVRLTPGEFRLLEYLVRNAGQILTHEQLLEAISANLSRSHMGILRQYISRLRRKIEADPALPRLIISHRGLGYSFSPEGDWEGGS